MIVVTVTGGLGAGKSTATRYFAERGAIVLDLDELAARLVRPGSPVLERLCAEFGDDILGFDGALDRKELARRAFQSAESAARLNAVVHPVLAAEIGPAMTNLRLLECPPAVVVLEVPLLVEAPVFGELADTILAISAPEDVRVQRAVAAGMARDDALRRIALQATDEQREAVADEVIVNDGDLETYTEQLDRFWVQNALVSPEE